MAAGSCLPIAVAAHFTNQLSEIAGQSAKLLISLKGSISDLKDLSAKDLATKAAAAATAAAKSYAVALGEDYVLALMRSELKKILDDVIKENPEILRAIEVARSYHELAMGTVAMLFSVHTGSVLYLVKKMCDKLETRINEKASYLAKIENNIDNIEKCLEAIAEKRLPWYDDFADNIEIAITKIDLAVTKLADVYLKLTLYNTFPSDNWDDAKDLVREAARLLEPEGLEDIDIDLAGQFETLITIPKESAELATNIAQYLAKSTEIDGLVQAIIAFSSAVKNSAGSFLNSWQAKETAAIASRLEEISIELQGILDRKSQIEAATKTIVYAIELEAIAYKMDFSFAKASEMLNEQQEEYQAYLEMVNKLCQRIEPDDVCNPLADNSNLFNYCTTLIKVANLFIVKDYPGWEQVIENCRSAIKTAYAVDAKILNAIAGFQMTENPLIEQVLDILDVFGLDKARDALLSGKIDEYFQMTVDVASYAGIAISCLTSSIKECTDVESKAKLQEMLSKIRGDEQRKQMAAANKVGGIQNKLSKLTGDTKEINRFQATLSAISEAFKRATA